MNTPKITDEIKTDIDEFMTEFYFDENRQRYLSKEQLDDELEFHLENYCEENDIQIDIEKTIDDFLTKRGKRNDS